MTAEIERIGSNNPSRGVVLNTLREAISRVENGDNIDRKYTKIIVVMLDDDNDEYNMGWSQGGMKMSECVTLAKIAEARFLTLMGY